MLKFINLLLHIDLKCVLVDARFSFPKNDANKRQILDFLIEIEDLVNVSAKNFSLIP